MREYKYLDTEDISIKDIIILLNKGNKKGGWRVVCPIADGFLLVREVNKFGVSASA